MRHLPCLLWIACLLFATPLSTHAQTETYGSPETETDTSAVVRWDPLQLRDSLDKMLLRPMFQSSQVGIYIYDLTADTAVYEHGKLQLMRPASLQKLLTSTAALTHLGSQHEFRTRMWVLGDVSDSIFHGDIYLQGGFDPCFNYADMSDFADSILHMGIKAIEGNVYSDQSFKDTLKWGEGWCWDDDEKELHPLLCNGKADFIERFFESLDERNILHPLLSTEKPVPAATDNTAPRCLAECRRNMDQILLPMLKNSNNLYAEATFYQMGASQGIHHPSVKLSSQKVYDLIATLGLSPDDYVVADGSGLSLYNYATPELMVMLLRHVWKTPALYSHIYYSLPIAGIDGTLHARMQAGTAFDNIHAKTGTLRGVSTLAGYATAADGRQLCFCIMNQGVRSNRQAHAFQDEVCQLLTGGFNDNENDN